MARGQNRKRVDSEAERSAAAGRLRKALMSLAFLALLAGTGLGAVRAWSALRDAQWMRIRALRWVGLAHATPDDLVALSPVREGDALLAADLGAVATAVGRHPWVKSVKVRRAWPPSLVVTVEERSAAALVDLGGLYLVDDEANVFKRAEAGDGLDLPVITGIARADYVQRRAAVEPLLRGALALAQAWRERGRDSVARLSEIHVDPGDGTTIYVGEEGTQVRLGSGDLGAKLARLEKMLAVLRTEGKTAEVLLLDNRVHPSWVTVRLATAQGVKGGGR